MNRTTFLDLCAANRDDSDRSDEWTEIADLKGQWNSDLEISLGDLPLHAVAYFFAMGVKQASGDVKAARGAFLGKGAGAWSEKDRVAAAKELGVTSYVDTRMVDRDVLADMYFAQKADDKLTNIIKGTVGSRAGTRRMTSDEARLFPVAESWYRVNNPGPALAAKLKTMREATPDLADSADETVLRAIILKGLANEAFRAKMETLLAAQKADFNVDGIF